MTNASEIHIIKFRMFVLMWPDKLALEFINQNWPSIYKVMIPETKDIWEPRMIEEMNAVLMHVPFRLFLN